MSWLSVALVIVTVTHVALRYIFARGSIVLQELEWQIFSLMFLLAAGYTLRHDAHVRVDVFYARLPLRVRAWIDLLGSLLLLLPFVAITVLTSVDFTAKAWAVREGSQNPGGLQIWYLIKTAIPVGFGLLGLQGIAQFANALITILDRPTEKPPSEGT